MTTMISNEAATSWISIYVGTIGVYFNKADMRFYSKSIGHSIMCEVFNILSFYLCKKENKIKPNV
jgi:hypothetical protein